MYPQPISWPVGGGEAVVTMTRRDKAALVDELVEVRAVIDRLNEEITALNADKDDREGAVAAAKKSELLGLQRREERLQSLISHAEEVKGRSDLVSIGSTARVLISGKESELTISPNGDPAKGKITPEAPVAKALLRFRGESGDRIEEGARVGDKVAADTPSGLLEVTVLEIRVDEDS